MSVLKKILAIIGTFVVTTSALLTLLTTLGFGPTVGPDVANAALAWLGDPCEGVTHPAYQSEVRSEILDGVRAKMGQESTFIFVVGVISMRDDWAYVEATPNQGPRSGTYRAYILTEIANGWGVKWDGPVGARPGEHDDYPDGFDDDLLRCKTNCDRK